MTTDERITFAYNHGRAQPSGRSNYRQLFARLDSLRHGRLFIPGTFMLSNKFVGPGQPYGESGPVRLQRLEERFTSIRLAELCTNPIAGRFDYDHMKAIHAYVFQDVYKWASQERTAPTTVRWPRRSMPAIRVGTVRRVLSFQRVGRIGSRRTCSQAWWRIAQRS